MTARAECHQPRIRGVTSEVREDGASAAVGGAGQSQTAGGLAGEASALGAASEGALVAACLRAAWVLLALHPFRVAVAASRVPPVAVEALPGGSVRVGGALSAADRAHQGARTPGANHEAPPQVPQVRPHPRDLAVAGSPHLVPVAGAFPRGLQGCRGAAGGASPSLVPAGGIRVAAGAAVGVAPGRGVAGLHRAAVAVHPHRAGWVAPVAPDPCSLAAAGACLPPGGRGAALHLHLHFHPPGQGAGGGPPSCRAGDASAAAPQHRQGGAPAAACAAGGGRAEVGVDARGFEGVPGSGGRRRQEGAAAAASPWARAAARACPQPGVLGVAVDAPAAGARQAQGCRAGAAAAGDAAVGGRAAASPARPPGVGVPVEPAMARQVGAPKACC
eukprot:m.339791 g.339791  ORF g.339791 m.339791 type:complete len:389 (-) comp16543_c0_seq1:229-1395(-)